MEPNRRFNNPHDLLARHFFPVPEVMVGFLRHYLKKPEDQRVIAQIDLEKLVCTDPVTVSDRLVEGRGDLRFSTSSKGSAHESNVYLLFEHQSYKDSDIRLRGLEHIVQDYKKFRAITKGREKFPYPILIVLYHGAATWEHVPAMDDLIEMVPGLKTGLLDYLLIFVDISSLTQDEFGGHPVLQVVLEMLQLATKGALAANLDRVMARLKSVCDDPRIYSWLSSFAQYVLATTTLEKEEVAKAFSQVLAKEEVYNMVMTTAEKLFTDGETTAWRKAVLRALRANFGEVPQHIEESIFSKTDPIALESLVERAVDSESLEDFAEGL
jgi:hypothetical protein